MNTNNNNNTKIVNNNKKFRSNRKRYGFKTKRYTQKNKNILNNHNDDYYFTKAFDRKFMNKIKKQLHKNTMALSNKPSQILVKTNPKKEIRYDKIYTAYDMYRMNKYYPLYKTTIPTIFYPCYEEFDVTINESAQDKVTSIYWMPYAFPYFNPSWKVRIDNQTLNCNFISTMGYFNSVNNVIDTVHVHRDKLVDIPGQQRLVCATMKLVNVSSAMARAGSYTAYKVTDERLIPIISTDGFNSLITDDQTEDMFEIVGETNLSPLNVKILGTSGETLTINEFNTMNGNNQFQSTDEFLGCKWNPKPLVTGDETTIQPTVQLTKPINYVGSNVGYIIKIHSLASLSQSYKVQSWKIYEISPDPNSSYSPIATVKKECIRQTLLAKLTNNMPFKLNKAY